MDKNSLHQFSVTSVDESLQLFGQGLKVWLMGDGYIRREEERARYTTGRNLGLDAHVWWFGWGGSEMEESLRGRTYIREHICLGYPANSLWRQRP
ncbi:hypothetical protein UPYG_G00142750 [Umbra pygmaea]|uniref:Uncharacterized protein n=1 Tax=Umbra pygmaea TaxID=75934 RepID=A0ABD0X095_UMBPY